MDEQHKGNPDKILNSISFKTNAFLPIIVNPYHIQQRNSFLFLSGFIKVTTVPDEVHSSSIPSEDKDKNIRFEIVDCNKLPMTKFHFENCSWLERFFGIARTFLFPYTEMCLFYSLNMWQFPTKFDVFFCW